MVGTAFVFSFSDHGENEDILPMGGVVMRKKKKGSTNNSEFFTKIIPGQDNLLF